MKKAEIFSYMLFGIALFSSLILIRFYKMNIITAMLGMLCGLALIACYMFHDKSKEG